MARHPRDQKEKTLWSGANFVLTNHLKCTVKPEFYEVTNFRLYKSNSRITRLGADTESMELFRITAVRVDQGPYQKFVGLGADDICISSADLEIIWRSVPRATDPARY